MKVKCEIEVDVNGLVTVIGPDRTEIWKGYTTGGHNSGVRELAKAVVEFEKKRLDEIAQTLGN